MADHSPPKEGARASPYTEHMEARMRIISKVLAERDDIRTLLPGLDSLLDDHLSPHVQVTQWEHFRRLLQVFRNSPDQTFEKCLDQLLPQQQKRIQKFVNGASEEDVCKGFRTGPSIGVRENARRMQGARQVHLPSHYPTRVKGLGSSEERWGDGCNMLVIKLLDIFRTFIGKLQWKGRGAKPDWNLVRRAWWDAVLACYRHADTCPQWMPLEMRITAGSEIVMASQRGNDLGTCSIEVLTLEAARDMWTPYAEEIVGLWTSYKDAEGRRLRTRPHWAKQWASLKVDGKPWVERLKSIDYKTEIEEFRGLLGEIGKGHGWTLEDLKRRFSSDFLDKFFFDVVEVVGQ